MVCLRTKQTEIFTHNAMQTAAAEVFETLPLQLPKIILVVTDVKVYELRSLLHSGARKTIGISKL